MKILHTVQSYYPDMGGMPEVVRQISENLARLGHQVTVATSVSKDRKRKVINGVNIISFEVTGNYIAGFKGEVEQYQNYVLDSDFDVVTNFAAQQWATDAILPFLAQIKGKKVFVPTGFSKLLNKKYHQYYLKMKLWMKQYDMNVFPCRHYRDIDFARRNRIRKITTIPNGASLAEFGSVNKIDFRNELNIPQDDFLILLVGSHTGFKGHYEAIKIFSRADIKKSTLLIIGNLVEGGCYHRCRLSALLTNLKLQNILSRKRVILANLPRTEIVKAYKSADLFLFPSNIECSPIVLFECLASRTPFLVTDVGNSKEIISWSRSGKMLPTRVDNSGLSHAIIEPSARFLESVYRDKKKLTLMAEAGCRVWRKSYTWEKISHDYEKLYISLVNKSVS